jgi:hypothetical protein
VAEFFATPTRGTGFRISVEAVEIALEALAGTAFYGLVALAGRASTFWHPSYRRDSAIRTTWRRSHDANRRRDRTGPHPVGADAGRR